MSSAEISSQQTSDGCRSDEDASQDQTQQGNGPMKASRQSNLQRIRQIKQNELSAPYNKKLLKLANYSKCQVSLRYYFLLLQSLRWLTFILEYNLSRLK